MRILGVDPGLRTTGYGAVEATDGHLVLLEGGVVTTTLELPLEGRLAELYDGLWGVLVDTRPNVVVVEELYSKYGHPKTAILMGHARAVAFLAAARFGAPVCGYTASAIKRSLTGSGRASKEQVQQMVARLLKLAEVPGPADVADALALAVCHASWENQTPGRRGGRRN
jgi:crossover junction endodeoxyribonuclease RuvC